MRVGAGWVGRLAKGVALMLMLVRCSGSSRLEPTSTPGPVFEQERAWAHAVAQCGFGPRFVGSEAGWATGDYIRAQLQAFGWQVEEQVFTYGGLRVRNLIGRKGSGPVVVLGAHYDTRPVAEREPDPDQRDQPILGANDGASGVAVLLELARVVDVEATGRSVWLAFFDAEDRAQVDGWPTSVGAEEMARRLGLRPEWVVVLDMVGDVDQQFYLEGHSDPQLQERLWAVAGELGYAAHFIPELRHTILDDHVPFVERGIPAVDVIDFDYPAWHTLDDTLANISAESLGRVGTLMEVWLEQRAWLP
jgi:glutaminyl-peptide cyclotransferase